MKRSFTAPEYVAPVCVQFGFLEEEIICESWNSVTEDPIIDDDYTW